MHTYHQQDIEGAMTPPEISNALGLSALKNRTWAIFKTSALKGDGLQDAMEWLVWGPVTSISEHHFSPLIQAHSGPTKQTIATSSPDHTFLISSSYLLVSSRCSHDD